MDLRRLRETELRRYLFEEESFTAKNAVLPIVANPQTKIAELFNKIRNHYDNGTRCIHFYPDKNNETDFFSITSYLSKELESLLGQLFIIAQPPIDFDINIPLSLVDSSSKKEVERQSDMIVFDIKNQNIPRNKTSTLLFPIYDGEKKFEPYLYANRDHIDGCTILNLPFGLERATKASEELMLPVLGIHSFAYADSLLEPSVDTAKESNFSIEKKQEALTAVKRAGATLVSSPLCW